MKLTGARVAIEATRSERIDLGIHKGRIRFEQSAGPDIDVSGCLILPGLINAHDHLEFNLFPRLGNGPYANAAEWAADIYRPEEPPIKTLLQIPKPDRLFWGGLKNLASGVTTVSHHNPYQPDVFDHKFPVRVVRRFGWAHSLDFTANIAARFRSLPRAWPFVVHAGEGTDARSRSEIERLDELGILTRRSILVHAVAADAGSVPLLKKRGTSLVWCPSSNFFLFGRTIDAAVLRSGLPVALGTDSGLTGAGDLVDEMRIAREQCGVEPERLYGMVTTGAARLLRLRNGEGSVSEGGVADLLIVPDRGQTPAETVTDLQPEMVMVGGRMCMVSPAFAKRSGMPDLAGWRPFEMEGRGAWLSRFDPPHVPALNGSMRLAGKKVRF